MKKVLANRSNSIMLALFLSTMIAYIIIFATAFAELPISIGPVHQLLLPYFHFIPMFFLELLLCKLTRPFLQALVPVILLAIPVLIFVATCGFHIMAWVLAGIWSVAPIIGSLLAFLIWRISRWLKKRNI